jgi:hypothetical protein
MRRDMKLAVRILAVIEECEGPIQLQPLHSALSKVEGVTLKEVMRHLELLKGAGFIEGNGFFPESISAEVKGLTWKGHDYLDANRPESTESA